jgi:hypothetical protein
MALTGHTLEIPLRVRPPDRPAADYSASAAKQKNPERPWISLSSTRGDACSESRWAPIFTSTGELI